METKQFYGQLAIVTAGVGCLLAGLHFGCSPARSHAGFAAGMVAVFALVSAGLFHMGKNTASSSSKLAFNNVISLSVFGKMVVSIALLWLYKSSAAPENDWFLLIFLLVYATYTVFEVMFMTRLARRG